MGRKRKSDLDRRLEAYFATLRSSPLREALKRSVGNWQLYAAVSGSAMAMMTGASAAVITSNIRVTPDPMASVRVAKQNLSSSNAPPFLKDVRLAFARQDAAQRFLNNARPSIDAPSQTATPSIMP